MSGQNLPLPSKRCHQHQKPYRTIKSHITPATTMQKLLQLSSNGKIHLEHSITIMQHLNQSKPRKINPQVRQELTTTV